MGCGVAFGVLEAVQRLIVGTVMRWVSVLRRGARAAAHGGRHDWDVLRRVQAVGSRAIGLAQAGTGSVTYCWYTFWGCFLNLKPNWANTLLQCHGVQAFI